MRNLKTRRGANKAMSQINVVPYIDVMLVLLVIFMVTTPLLSQGVKVNLPSAHAKTLAAKQEPIILSVNARGQYYLNIAKTPSVPVSAIAIMNTVSEALKANQSRTVLVKGDKAVSYGRIMQAMVLLQNAGANNVGLITAPLTSGINNS